jgi:mercuric ion transport protein
MNDTGIIKSWIPGMFAALSASLCCITPLMAVLGGFSGIASSFSWIEPARPYLICATIIIFSFAWYQQLIKRAQQSDNCACEVKAASFLQNKKVLLTATLFSGVLMVFPCYSHFLYGVPKQSASIVQQSNLKWVQLSLKGMGCADCTKHIDGVLSKVAGVMKVSTSYEKAQTIITYDPEKTTIDSLKNKINQIGYRVTGVKTR